MDWVAATLVRAAWLVVVVVRDQVGGASAVQMAVTDSHPPESQLDKLCVAIQRLLR